MNQYIAKDKLHDQTFLWKWNDADHTVVPPTKTEKKKRQDEVCKKRTLFFNIFILLYKYQKASFITSNSSILWSPPYTPNYFPNSSKHKQVQQQSYSTTSVLFYWWNLLP